MSTRADSKILNLSFAQFTTNKSKKSVTRPKCAVVWNENTGYQHKHIHLTALIEYVSNEGYLYTANVVGCFDLLRAFLLFMHLRSTNFTMFISPSFGQVGLHERSVAMIQTRLKMEIISKQRAKRSKKLSEMWSNYLRSLRSAFFFITSRGRDYKKKSSTL